MPSPKKRMPLSIILLCTAATVCCGLDFDVLDFRPQEDQGRSGSGNLKEPLVCSSCYGPETCREGSMRNVTCPQNATGCIISYANPRRTSVLRMGCSAYDWDQLDLKTNTTKRCYLGADNRYRCSCTQSMCNYQDFKESEEEQESHEEGPNVWRCYTCKGIEDCDTPQLNTVTCRAVDGYNACVTSFNTLEDIQSGTRAVFRGCVRYPESLRRLPVCTTSTGSDGREQQSCYCRNTFCNFRIVRNPRNSARGRDRKFLSYVVPGVALFTNAILSGSKPFC